MVEQQVVGMAEVDELAVVARQRLEAMIGGLDEDLGLVAGAAQDALDAEHFVSDRVSVPERREHLVDPDHARRSAAGARPSAGPVGSFATTSAAGGRSCLRRSNHPGSGSALFGAACFFSRSNRSRY